MNPRKRAVLYVSHKRATDIIGRLTPGRPRRNVQPRQGAALVGS